MSLLQKKTAKAKPKCPHCGSAEYSLMPSDFETAKCERCGKNWDHGIVRGINDPNEKTADVRTSLPQNYHGVQQPGAYAYDPQMEVERKPIAETPQLQQSQGYSQYSQEPLPEVEHAYEPPVKPSKINPRIREVWKEQETPTEVYASKGTTAGYSIAVESPIKTASSVPMFISSIEFDSATRVEKFTFTADKHRATVFHHLTAAEVMRQLTGPSFGIKAHIVTAANFEDMFKTIEHSVPQSAANNRAEIKWAKTCLKKNDRMVWYLRWYRLALVESIISNLRKGTGGLQPKAGAEVAEAPVETQKPQQPSLIPQMEKLLVQYKKELSAKGGNPETYNSLVDFPGIKRSLEHFYSLNLPDIETKVLTSESYNDIYNIFSAAEHEWQQQAKGGLAPHEEDKVFIQFPDGWAWYWLPRAACSEEKEAMGHCGNSPMAGRENVSILSLREPKKQGGRTLWYPHATFILHGEGDHGVLGEMKGRANAKPVAKYHPYIIQLLKDPRIEGIAGGGHAPKKNFSFHDLTEEQRKEVMAANPNIGLSIRDYYDEHGMDDNLGARVATILGLGADAYDHRYGFIIRRWPDMDEFIDQCGDSEAKKAWAYVESGRYLHDEPDHDDLLDLMDHLSDSQINHVGIALQYHYPKEIDEWYPKNSFDPRDVSSIKKVFTDIFREKVDPVQKVQQKRERDSPGLTKEESNPATPYGLPVISEFYNAYMAGGPDQMTVEEEMSERVTEAIHGLEDGTSVDYDGKGGILQVLEPEQAIETATRLDTISDREETAREYSVPSLNVPYDWDDWDQDHAVEALASRFDSAPSRPEQEGQGKLPFEGEGEKISSLKHPLFAAPKKLKKPMTKFLTPEQEAFAKKHKMPMPTTPGAYTEYTPRNTHNAYDLWENWDKALPFTGGGDGFVNVGDTHEAAFAEHEFKGKVPEEFDGYEDLASQWGDAVHARGWVAKDRSRMMLWDTLHELLTAKKEDKYKGLKAVLQELKKRKLITPETELYDNGGEAQNYEGTLKELGLFPSS